MATNHVALPDLFENALTVKVEVLSFSERSAPVVEIVR